MADEEVFSQSRMKNAMAELMKSEEGRKLADQLKTKLKDLNDQFKGLSGNEKEIFLKEFKTKFADSLGDLKDTLKMHVADDTNGDFKIRGDESQTSFTQNDYAPQPNYFLFLFAIVLVVLVFG